MSLIVYSHIFLSVQSLDVIGCRLYASSASYLSGVGIFHCYIHGAIIQFCEQAELCIPPWH